MAKNILIFWQYEFQVLQAKWFDVNEAKSERVGGRTEGNPKSDRPDWILGGFILDAAFPGI